VVHMTRPWVVHIRADVDISPGFRGAKLSTSVLMETGLVRREHARLAGLLESGQGLFDFPKDSM
jgi:hypothetical protein